jgi:DNA replication protein DnaC
MTIHDPSLRAALKTLKLTGMLDTLDARLAQTRDGKLGHLEFLQVLCEDEIARRETAALARRVRRARFEQPNTFEDFDFTVSPKLPAAMLRDLSALRWLEAGESVILYGPVGVGKTHVAQALGHQVARRGGDIRFVKCSRMLADLAGGHADRTIGQRMREYTRPLVLIVDDFAMREHTPTQSDDLYDLVSDRAIAAKPLILTSNRAPKDWYPLFPNPVVAESLLDPRHSAVDTDHLRDGRSIFRRSGRADPQRHRACGAPRRRDHRRQARNFEILDTRRGRTISCLGARRQVVRLLAAELLRVAPLRSARHTVVCARG